MKIVDKIHYEGTVPFFVDLNRFIAVNGQLYKKDFTPVPFKYLPDQTSNCWRGFNSLNRSYDSWSLCPISAKKMIKDNYYTNILLVNRCSGHPCYGGVYGHETNQTKTLSIVDSVNENVTYNLCDTSIHNNVLLKNTIDDKGNITQQSVTVGKNNLQFVGQSEEYLYLTSNNWADRGSKNGCASAVTYNRDILYNVVRKSDLSIITQNAGVAVPAAEDKYEYSENKPVYEDDDYLYLYSGQYVSMNSRVFSYLNKRTNILTNLYIDGDNSDVGMACSSSGFIFDGEDTIFGYFGKCVNESNIIKLKIYKFEIYKSSMQYSCTDTGKYIQLSKTYPAHYIMRCCTTFSGGQYYITFIPCNRMRYSNIEASDNNIHTFTVLEDKSLSDAILSPIANVAPYIDYIDRYDGRQLALASKHSIDFYNFNEQEGCFQFTERKLVTLKQFFMDHHNRLWCTNEQNTLEVINEQTPINANVRFAETQYSFDGTPIDTFVYVSCTNMDGVLISGEVSLQLYGDCRFTNNMSKEMLITTESSSEITLGVTITGSGPIRVSAKIRTM